MWYRDKKNRVDSTSVIHLISPHRSIWKILRLHHNKQLYRNTEHFPLPVSTSWHQWIILSRKRPFTCQSWIPVTSGYWCWKTQGYSHGGESYQGRGQWLTLLWTGWVETYIGLTVRIPTSMLLPQKASIPLSCSVKTFTTQPLLSSTHLWQSCAWQTWDHRMMGDMAPALNVPLWMAAEEGRYGWNPRYLWAWPFPIQGPEYTGLILVSN